MAPAKKQILGISDSKSLFVPSWKPPVYFEYMLSLCGKARPVVYYVGAAKGDCSEKITEFYELSARVPCQPRTLKLFNLDTDDNSSFFEGADVIYIDGGSTRNLMVLMQEWNVFEALVGAYNAGVVIVGASAGINMLFDWCMTDSIRTKILPFPGIGLLPGSICVHRNVRQDRVEVFQAFLEGPKAKFPAYALDDGVGVHFVDGGLVGVYTVSGDCRLRVYTAEQGVIKENEIRPEFIGSGVGQFVTQE